MSAWLHLRSDIVWEFYEQALLGRERRDTSALILANEEYWRRWHRDKPYNDKRRFRERVATKVRHKRLRAAIGGCIVCNGPVLDGRRMSRVCSEKCRHRANAVAATAKRRARVADVLSSRRCCHCLGPIEGASTRRIACSRRCIDAHQRTKRRHTETVPAVYPTLTDLADGADHKDP